MRGLAPARLVTQEISLMKETRSPRLAFNRQSRLLKDAFSEEEWGDVPQRDTLVVGRLSDTPDLLIVET